MSVEFRHRRHRQFRHSRHRYDVATRRNFSAAGLWKLVEADMGLASLENLLESSYTHV